VKIKLNPIREVITASAWWYRRLHRRGTTSRARIKTLREVGAGNPHARELPAAPVPLPVRHRFSDARGADRLVQDAGGDPAVSGADSLSYLSYEGMLRAMTLPAENFCTRAQRELSAQVRQPDLEQFVARTAAAEDKTGPARA
jgi:amidophosphoribosyltransferase